MTDLPSWWGRVNSRRTPIKRVVTIKKPRMRRAPLPRNAVRTPRGTKATSPKPPKLPTAAKPGRKPTDA
jgi:hypothetical protein